MINGKAVKAILQNEIQKASKQVAPLNPFMNPKMNQGKVNNIFL